jgi:hypothetical protein
MRLTDLQFNTTKDYKYMIIRLMYADKQQYLTPEFLGALGNGGRRGTHIYHFSFLCFNTFASM